MLRMGKVIVLTYLALETAWQVARRARPGWPL
jgi:hypothetical protein